MRFRAERPFNLVQERLAAASDAGTTSKGREQTCMVLVFVTAEPPHERRELGEQLIGIFQTHHSYSHRINYTCNFFFSRAISSASSSG